MTQLRSSSFIGQAAEDRVQAVVEFGFTERQARFLVTVMLHSGVCLPRQYEAFAGIVHGKRTGRFFRKLIKHGYAAAYPCRHNRGRVYHVHHKPLYRAIGETDSRHRRPMSAARVEEALMLLDAMLIDPRVMWLATVEEMQIHLSRQASVSVEDAVRLTATQPSRPARSMRDRMPVGVDQEARWVFPYLLTDLQREDFHWFLQQHSALFAVLPAWVVQIVCPHGKGVAELYEKEARYALQPVSPRVASHVPWYFKLHRAHTQEGAPLGDHEQDYYETRYAFGGLRFQVLYRRWLVEGDTVLDSISSDAIAEALKRGTGRIECHVLPFAYRHLSPLVGSARPSSQGAEDADDSDTPSRPPVTSSIAGTDKAADNATRVSA
jgi:hypothetical protein